MTQNRCRDPLSDVLTVCQIHHPLSLDVCTAFLSGIACVPTPHCYRSKLGILFAYAVTQDHGHRRYGHQRLPR